jgi:hypothetical protein
MTSTEYDMSKIPLSMYYITMPIVHMIVADESNVRVQPVVHNRFANTCGNRKPHNSRLYTKNKYRKNTLACNNKYSSFARLM